MSSILKLPYKLFKYNIIPFFRLLKIYFTTPTENTDLQKKFIGHLSRYKKKVITGSDSFILCQSIEDHINGLKMASVSAHLAEKFNSNICFYSVGTRIEDERYKGEKLLDRLLCEKKYRIQDSFSLAFGSKIVMRNVYPHKDINKVQKTFNFLKKISQTKEEVINLQIEGVIIGDLVYDTYLRFINKATLDLNDPNFDKILYEAVNIYYNVQQLCEKYKFKALVNSYATYIHHGIIARVFLKKNIPVYTVGWYYSLVHRMRGEYLSHANNHFQYKKLFNLLDNKQERISSVKTNFEKRFTGDIDAATSYMRESAYSSRQNAELKKIDWSNTVVLLAHCFFDSPHIYRKMLFPDFYEWMTFTLDFFSQNPHIRVIVKEHPNGIKGNDKIFEKLQQKFNYPNIIFIDKKTSQLDIMHNKPKAILTVHGTAAAEFAYMGFPVVALYDNPFTGYDFVHLANTKHEYLELLKNILELNPKQKKDDILEYYYMHNYFYLKGRDFDHLGCIKYFKDSYSDAFLEKYLPDMTEGFMNELDLSIKEGIDLIDWEAQKFTVN